MQKENIRCWEIESKHGTTKDYLYITYPEGSLGHRLVSCLNCGQIFSVNLTKELYIGPPLEVKLKTLHCPKCGKLLANYAYEYPAKYLSTDGKIYDYRRDDEIPNDDLSMVKEFLEIYSE